MKLLLGSGVKAQLERSISSGGAYLLAGPAGLGKFYAIDHLARAAIKHPHNLIIVESEGQSIGIDDVHDINKRLKLASVGGENRVVIVRDAEKMTAEAQNAFLKNLEEPPAGTSIYLTCQNSHELLPTIRSRMKIVEFKPVTKDVVADYLRQELELNGDQAAGIGQLSGGGVGRAIELANEPEAHEQLKSRQTLGQKLTSQTSGLYEKLKLISEHTGRQAAKEILTEASQQLRKQIRLAVNGQRVSEAKRLTRQLKHAQQLLDYLKANGNDKLALTHLVLNTTDA